MIQGYLHSFHIRVVSVLFLENSMHRTVFCLCDQDAVAPGSGLEVQTSPQQHSRGSSTGSVRGSHLALGKLCHHSVPQSGDGDGTCHTELL